MLKNYFRIAIRNFRANKYFSLANIAGLAIGLSASLVIYLVVQYDFSFDKFEKDRDRIYRVVGDYTFSSQTYYGAGAPAAMPAAFNKEITGLDIVAPLYIWNRDVKMSIPGKNEEQTVFKKQDHIVFADAHYFELLPYTWIAGSPTTSLAEAYQVVLTESNAKKYFPAMEPGQVIGKEIVFNDTVRTTVTGVVKDQDRNTDFTFTTFVSRATIETPRLKPDDGDEWGSASPSSQLFVKLSGGTNSSQIDKRVAVLLKK
jgi:putative ABC transport system permease protein